jgi:hypothetical protein
MSYPAILNNELIVRSLKGECYLRLRDGLGVSFAGEVLREHLSCGDCLSQCSSHKDSTGITGKSFGIEIKMHDSGVSLWYSCPSCGVSVTEDTSLIDLSTTMKSIESDPACCRCRKVQANL